MKVLLVYPEYPETFWSFKHALKFISKKADGPPLGLLTVAAMLPEKWEKRVIDMNTSRLKDSDIRWADMVFLTGINIQMASFREVIRRCKALDITVVAGGPMVTADYQEFPEVDHFVLNEAEVTLPMFLKDLAAGKLKHIYTSEAFPDICTTPVPLWNLVNMNDYASMYLQYSRGCPFDCEFCAVTMLNGHKPRTKNVDQFLSEVNSLYEQEWRGGVFIVDDNFIGNKNKLKTEVLPALVQWSRDHGFPFEFITEASINLADDDELINLMVQAGFNSVFIGIETPNSESLAECGKSQNLGRDMVASVKKLQNHGLRVSGGFIIGFDHDPPGIFEQQIKFIQKSGIVTAMVGLLNAPSGTRLYQRLKSENRLLNIATGDNVSGSMNFVPRMSSQKLFAGYKEVLTTIYSNKAFYSRINMLLNEYHSPMRKPGRPSWHQIQSVLKLMWELGVREKGKCYYWRLFFLTLLKHPRKFPLAMTMAAYGFHFRRIVATV